MTPTTELEEILLTTEKGQRPKRRRQRARKAVGYKGTTLHRALANLTSPPIIAIPAFATLCFKTADPGRAMTLFISCVLFQTLIPVAYLFWAFTKNAISDIHLYHREERTSILFVFTLNYLLGTFVLLRMNSPQLLTALMCSSAVLIFTILLINTSYKVSIHAVGLTGLLTGIFFAFGPKAFFLESLVPLVGVLRVRNNAHIMSQIVVGAILGHGLTYCVLKLWL